MQRWNGAHEWEEIKQLGSGGQSDVYLVRKSSRIQERRTQLAEIMRLGAQGLDEKRAKEFSEAIAGYNRPDLVSELGALKVYKRRDDESQATDRLRVEIIVLSNSREGLPKLFDSNVGERWVVTEYCPGGTLESRIHTYRGKAYRSLATFHHIAKTAAELHKSGVVHRDIKPSNVLFDSTDKPVLGDLGIALPLDAPARPTHTNESVGPTDYRPPWADTGQRLEHPEANFDVYMLGKLLWCMVAGKLKLPREWHRRPEYDLTLLFKGDPNMHAINSILDKCLQEDPKACLPDAGELLVIVEKHWEVMQRGGQMLRPGVPRPCRVCGTGYYQPLPLGNQTLNVLAFHSGSVSVPGNYSGSWSHQGAFYATFLICDSCGHVQLFKAT